MTTEEGTRIYAQPEETWIEVAVPPLVDEATWERAQQLKKERLAVSKRNTKVSYLLQHLLRCSECGLRFRAKAKWGDSNRSNGKVYRYEAAAPLRYYHCHGLSRRLCCRERPYIRAERLEDLVWSEVKRVLQNPALIVQGGARASEGPDGGGPGHPAVRVGVDHRGSTRTAAEVHHLTAGEPESEGGRLSRAGGERGQEAGVGGGGAGVGKGR